MSVPAPLVASIVLSLAAADAVLTSVIIVQAYQVF